MRFDIVAALLLPAALLTACSRESADSSAAGPAASTDYKVIEHYEVGRGVYVRALAVDAASRTLWVGTSLGLQQIDLATFEAVGT
jgi:hypothetical protein